MHKEGSLFSCVFSQTLSYNNYVVTIGSSESDIQYVTSSLVLAWGAPKVWVQRGRNLLVVGQQDTQCLPCATPTQKMLSVCQGLVELLAGAMTNDPRCHFYAEAVASPRQRASFRCPPFASLSPSPLSGSL